MAPLPAANFIRRLLRIPRVASWPFGVVLLAGETTSTLSLKCIPPPISHRPIPDLIGTDHLQRIPGLLVGTLVHLAEAVNLLAVARTNWTFQRRLLAALFRPGIRLPRCPTRDFSMTQQGLLLRVQDS